ncbi:glucuronate isomerase [Microbacterium marmarense]|uniref:Uronate isomerase n=1 Tax=Microbacterium marmarense TaxID=3122051 RepID=A0ABU8LTF9_9MICO
MPTLPDLADGYLMPADAQVRSIAIDLYESVADLPILSPHGHVSPRMISDDVPFSDPTDLLITHDHYVTRVLHSAGHELSSLGLGGGSQVAPRDVWRLFAANWHRYAGTASGYWLTRELETLFGITEELSLHNADELYDRIAAELWTPGFRPRALFERFRIEVLATTDDPLDDLSEHRALAADPTFSGRVLPTFRPDAYLDPDTPEFGVRIEQLLSATAQRTTFDGYLCALAERRAHFVENGAVSADHGVYEPFTADLDRSAAERLFSGAVRGQLDPDEARLFRGHMLMQMAGMSVEDGLVMTLHPGVRRNHHSETLQRFGPDMGHDIPVRTEYVENLRPLLQKYGVAPGFHLVLFTIDETTYSREIAPLAGFYPSVYIGAPWWFLDAPDAILRWRSSVTETAGFYRSSGFIDDTRAFCSIPARHDTSRRLDAAFLARLVHEGRVSLPMARRIAEDLVDTIPREVFKL